MATCFDLHWLIFRPSKKTDLRLHRFFYKNAFWDPKCSQEDYKCTVEIVEYIYFWSVQTSVIYKRFVAYLQTRKNHVGHFQDIETLNLVIRFQKSSHA